VKNRASTWIQRDVKRKNRNAEAYDRVQKILQEGCPKKSLAVREAAIALDRSERSVWTSLREHEERLKSEAWADRQWEIEAGLEQPTEEEIQERVDMWIQHMIDVRRGK
jgi:hypothetical protein